MRVTLLPVVGRELREAARRPGTHVGRILVAALSLLIFIWLMLFLMPQAGVDPNHYGPYLFRSIFAITIIYCLAGSAGTTADSLSREKREGTLGLLFLTDLKGYDIVLGKLAASSLNLVYSLLAMIPVLTLSSQLGGVTWKEIAYAAIALLNLMFFAVAIGISVSAISRNERKAMLGVWLAVVGLCLLPGFACYLLAEVSFWIRYSGRIMLGILSLSPLYAVGHVLVPQGGGTPTLPTHYFWQSILATQVVGWTCVAVTSRSLPWIWRARESATRLGRRLEAWTQWTYGSTEGRRRLRRRLLEVNPFLWLAQREWGKPVYAWGFVLFVMLIWLAADVWHGRILSEGHAGLPTLLLFQVVLKVWVGAESCIRLSEDRGSGALELLLSTPLTERDILHGQWLALRRQFLWPLVLFSAFELWLLWRLLSPVLALGWTAVLVTDFLAMGWVGMWLGLRSKTHNRALLQSVFLILVLPSLLTLILWSLGHSQVPPQHFSSAAFTHGKVGLWLLVGLVTDIGVAWGWARPRVLRHIRVLALRHADGSPGIKLAPEAQNRWIGIR